MLFTQVGCVNDNMADVVCPNHTFHLSVIHLSYNICYEVNSNSNEQSCGCPIGQYWEPLLLYVGGVLKLVLEACHICTFCTSHPLLQILQSSSELNHVC